MSVFRTCLVQLGALLTLVVSEPGADAQTHSGAFKPLRYEEDWRPACDDREGSDAPALKCIALDEDTILSLGADVRERAEFVDNALFGLGTESDEVFLHRVLAHADLRQGDRVRAFLQLGYFDTSGRDGPAPATDVDRFDLVQAFADVSADLGIADVTVRLGRQEIAYGSSRIISIRGGPNVRRSLDGVRVIARRGDWRVDSLYARPVEIKPGAFDDATDDTEALWGVYATGPLSGPHRADLYYLGYRQDVGRYASGAGPEERHSFGARYFGELQGFDWDWEGLLQTGPFAGGDIRAWTLATETGYTFSAPYAPRLGVKADIASGDKNPSDQVLGTFNAIYPKFPYFSEASLIAPANIIDLHPEVSFRPFEQLAVYAGVNFLWRHRTEDAVYVPPLRPLPGTAGAGGHYTGSQVILGADWTPRPDLSFSGQYVSFAPGNALERLGGRSGSFLMLSASWRY